MVGKTGKKVKHKPYTIKFKSEENSIPFFFANMQSIEGGDTATLRMKKLSKDKARLFVEEEKSKNAEMAHAKENIGWMALYPNPFSKEEPAILVEVSNLEEQVSFY